MGGDGEREEEEIFISLSLTLDTPFIAFAIAAWERRVWGTEDNTTVRLCSC